MDASCPGVHFLPPKGGSKNLTAKEVYEKMILEEIKPENALSFFLGKKKNYGQLTEEEKEKQETLYKLGYIEPATEEQHERELKLAIESGDQQRIFLAHSNLVKFQVENKYDKAKHEADLLFLDDCIKEAKDMIASQNPGSQSEPEKWRKYLMDKGFVFPPDGKRVINNFDLTAAEYVIYTKQNVTSKFLEESFLKDNGAKYSQSACNKARDYANTKQ